MEEIKILEILTKKAEKYNVSFCGVESNAIIETVNEALSLHNVVGQSEQLKAVKELVDFARDVTNVCDLDRLEEILDRL